MSEAGGRLAVIPARGGSKRIPGKNLVPLAGKPLLAYTIEAALGSGLFDRVVVTTDSLEIAEAARDLGAEVPFTREPSLSDDVVPVSAATLDALERVDPDGSAVTRVCQLMPNCPLRTAEDIRVSAEQFERLAADSQISVVRYGWQNPWWAMRRSEQFVLEPLFAEAATARSQDLPELFCPTGAVWWASAACPAPRRHVPHGRQSGLGDPVATGCRHRHRGRSRVGTSASEPRRRVQLSRGDTRRLHDRLSRRRAFPRGLVRILARADGPGLPSVGRARRPECRGGQGGDGRRPRCGLGPGPGGRHAGIAAAEGAGAGGGGSRRRRARRQRRHHASDPRRDRSRDASRSRPRRVCAAAGRRARCGPGRDVRSAVASRLQTRSYRAPTPSASPTPPSVQTCCGAACPFPMRPCSSTGSCRRERGCSGRGWGSATGSRWTTGSTGATRLVCERRSRSSR